MQTVHTCTWAFMPGSKHQLIKFCSVNVFKKCSLYRTLKKIRKGCIALLGFSQEKCPGEMINKKKLCTDVVRKRNREKNQHSPLATSQYYLECDGNCFLCLELEAKVNYYNGSKNKCNERKQFEQIEVWLIHTYHGGNDDIMIFHTVH